MQLWVFRALWGMPIPITLAHLDQIAEAGYDGIEAWTGALAEGTKPHDFAAQVAARGLKLIMAAQASAAHELEPTLCRLAEFQPVKIGLHSGLDCMTRDEGEAFFETALRIEEQIGLPVAHETHRGRMFFSPWDTLYYLNRFPELKVVADYSHWVNVCERLPDDQAAALDLANRRAIHIHGRVGYEEGPQVPDPAAPEYKRHLLWHEAQWQQIKAHRLAAGAEVLTFTPEYGPPMYLHTLPFTNVPVADLWQVCLWGAARARAILG
jgi:sugar phosphate isomerase/epimerase